MGRVASISVISLIVGLALLLAFVPGGAQPTAAQSQLGRRVVAALPAAWAYPDRNLRLGASGWHIETVDTELGSYGGFTSLALAESAYPRISYYTYTNTDLKYAYRDAFGWHAESVDNEGWVGEYTSLALDTDGYPHISYRDCGNGDLKYAYQDDSGWHIEIVDNEGDVGLWTSLTLDGGDYPHIGYFGNGDLKYTYQDASGWHIETVDSEGWVGTYSSLALDGDGYPHISYFDDTNAYLKYAYQDASGWHFEAMDDKGGTYTSLALDGSGYPHIGYHGHTHELKYAYQDASGWHIETVDIPGYVGSYISLALDGGGYPHISYHDWSNYDLKYAYQDGSGWHIETVDSEGYVGSWTSLALGENGYPHISYYDSSNGALKYAYYSAAPPTPTPTPTPTSTSTPTATPTATSTLTPTPTPTPTSTPAADDYEDDDSCVNASTIPTDGSHQTHTFHDEGDQDWVRFTAVANKTYVIQTSNPGPRSDAVLFLYDACEAPPLAAEDDAFAPTVRLEWDSTKSGTYYLKLQQHDTTIYGDHTYYDLSVTVDTVPPSRPGSPRCAALNETTIGVQWQRSPERDVVGYRIYFHDADYAQSGAEDVEGTDTTYYELGDLTPYTLYYINVSALDFSDNESARSAEIPCRTIPPTDTTEPSVWVEQPSATTVCTTTLGTVTIAGSAQDLGDNLSRVQVRNVTLGIEGWDYGLEGNSDDFRVEGINLGVGDNEIEVTAHDNAGNTGSASLTIHRLAESLGAAIIVAGHNDTYGLQTNINHAANRAYQVFQGAGFGDEDIYYLAPDPQDPNGDGVYDEVDDPATAENLQYAIETWAREDGRVGPGKPLYLYLIDHGDIEGFCTDGCGSSGRTTSQHLDNWLSALEASALADEVNVIIEACHSGSFIDRVGGVLDSISKAGRVIVTSTDRDNRAYASARGAYFSDAFFSCVAASNDLKTCFDQGQASVATTGNSQAPWIDDNGDGLSNPSDGTIAQNRYVARFFGASSPQIVDAEVIVEEGSGVLTAWVERGAEEIELVWAAVYAPSFEEPTFTTLELGVPLLRLEVDPEFEGLYRVSYPGGFTEEGRYRVVFYAEDRSGAHAQPKLVTVGERKVYLPLIMKNPGG